MTISFRALILTRRHSQAWLGKFWVFFSMYVLVPCVMMYGFSKSFGMGGEAMHFMLPGFMVNSAGIAAFAAATYGTFVRLNMERLYDAWLAATVNIPELICAEVLWAAGRSVIISSGVALAGCLLSGDWPIWQIFTAFPVIMLTSAVACLLGLMVVSKARAFDDIALFEPLTMSVFVFSGVFVSTSNFPEVIQWLVMFQPIYHGIEVVRPLFEGEGFGWASLGHIGVLVGMLAATFWATCYLFKKRIMGS